MSKWGYPDTFTVETPIDGWSSDVSPWIAGAKEASKPNYQGDENLKKLYGVELAKAENAFQAACKIFEGDTSKALWISFNWAADPVVIASRDIYLKTIEAGSPPLDKAQLAAKVLALADEKFLKNGVLIPVSETKDRIAALKLYSDILGYTGKVDIDASTKTFNHTEMVIKLVKPEVKAASTIENIATNIKSEITNENSPITLKLVGGASR